MAINPESQYPGKIKPASSNYPYGEARNITTPGDGTGTPWEAALLNDIFGAQQALLKSASIVPSGTPDKVAASQYLQSLIELVSGRAFTYDEAGVADAYILNVRVNQQLPASYFNGLVIKFIPLNNNTGASTANLGGIGVANLKPKTGFDFSANDLVAGIEYIFTHDGTDFILTSQSKVASAGVGAIPRTLQDKARDIVSVKDFGAIGDGVVDDTTAIQNACTVAGHILFGHEKTYLATTGISVPQNTTLNLNGSAVNFVTTIQDVGFSLDGNNTTIGNGAVDFNGTNLGGVGKYMSAITTGDQAAGPGYNTIRMHDLTVSTNRDDGGAPITLFVDTSNVVIENIIIPDNPDILFAIVCEWGGKSPLPETGHPHNIKISNIIVGDMSRGSLGAATFTGAIWLSGCFNVTVDSTQVEASAGLVGVNKGDRGNVFAPAAYKELVGSGIKISNSGIESCTNTPFWVLGELGDFPKYPVVFQNVTAISANGVGYGLYNAHSDGVVFNESLVDGFLIGVKNTTDSRNLTVSKTTITNSLEQGILGGDDNTKNTGLVVDRCKLFRNNRNGSTSRFTGAAISLFNTARSKVIDCEFEYTDLTTTQRHSITGSISTISPSITGNRTKKIAATGGAAYHFGEPEDTLIGVYGADNRSEESDIYAGCPVFEVISEGRRVTSLSAVPTTGTWVQGDSVYITPVASGTREVVCVDPGTFSSATDSTGDTDGSTAVITGMTDTSDFLVGEFVTPSAGFPSTSTPYKILALTATTMTLDTNSDSVQSNITVVTIDPVFKISATIAA